MSDQPEPAVPPLDPRDEEAVRRLLAEARHTEPLPADVAARLDDVLAGLATEAPGEPVPAAAPVVDLAARRRRRNAGRLLAAAAAVIVAGVGVGQVIGTDSPSSSDDSGAGSAVSNEAPDRESSAAGAPSSAPEAVSPDTLAQLPLDLTSSALAPQLEEGLARLAETDGGTSPPQGLLSETPDYSCPAAPPGLNLVPAYLDGRTVVVSLTATSDGEQQATVVDCTTGDEVTTVRVAAP